jgi:hypothetical protein
MPMQVPFWIRVISGRIEGDTLQDPTITLLCSYVQSPHLQETELERRHCGTGRSSPSHGAV